MRNNSICFGTQRTKFFKFLFDLETDPKTRKPYIDIDIGCLSGGGVPGMTGSTLDPKNVAWLVLKNLQNEVADVVPVLVSRNVDETTLQGYLKSYDGSATDPVECGKAGGNKATPFGNKAWIMIRKSGAAQTIKAKYSKLNVIFNRQSFDNSALESDLSFLQL